MGVVLGAMLRSDTIQITPEILALIARIDEFKGAWRALGTLAPDRLSALRRVATIESIGSSTRIEGSKLSDREVERLLSNLEIKSFATRDEQEVAGYAEVMDLVFSSWQDIPFTENHIKQLHRILLRYSEKDAWHRGNYKTNSNSVAAFDENGAQIGIVFETATPFDTPRLMTELVTWVSGERDSGAPASAADHRPVRRGVSGDPSVPGRQRPAQPRADDAAAAAGRLRLCAVQLAGERDRAEQGSLLPGAAADAGNDPHRGTRTGNRGWCSSCARWPSRCGGWRRRSSARRLVLAALPELSLQIVEFAREHGRVTIGEAIKLTGASRNTLKQHFRALVERGHLNQHGSGRGVWYELK